MTQDYPIDTFMPKAEAYFSRSSFSAPVFVGDDRIVFVDDRSGTAQVSALTLSSGQIEPVTTYGERIQSLKANAGTGKILFGMDQDGNERQQLWVIDEAGSAPCRLTQDDDAIHEPGAISGDGTSVLMRSNAREASSFDIIEMDLRSGEQAMLLEGGGQVTPVDLHRDGLRALIVRSNGNMDDDLLLLERDGTITNLMPHDGEQGIAGASFDHAGTGVWAISSLDRDFAALMHRSLEEDTWSVAYSADWDVESFKVSPDGSQVVISVNEDGASVARIISLEDSSDVLIDSPRGVIDQFSWSPDSKSVAFGVSTVEHPSVIALAGRDGKTRVVASAEEASPPKTFVPETVRFTSFDGREIPGFLFLPEGPRPFPVLVDIHGGPESQRRLNYAPSGPVLQYLTSLGMAVLSLNVRGSTGYGKAYSHLDDKGKRLDSVKDVEYAVKWLRERDDVDPERIAVYGRSYGGFMTLAAMVFYPDLWAAGVEMVGIANFVSFLERTGPWRRKRREAEYGELENDREMLERISPIHYLDNIRAPLMVCHGRHDPRVPLFEAEQVVEAVQRQGQDVVLRVYDNEGHALSKRPNVLDAFALMGAFLSDHLRIGPA